MGISQMIADAKAKFNNMKTKQMEHERQRIAKDIVRKAPQMQEAKRIEELKRIQTAMDKKINANKPQSKTRDMLKGMVKVLNDKRKEHQATGYKSPFSPGTSTGPFSNTTFNPRKVDKPKEIQKQKTIVIKVN